MYPEKASMKDSSWWPAVASTIDMRKGKTIFRARLVKVGKVYANPLFFVLLLDDVGEPIRIVYFSEESRIEQLLDLVIHYLIPFNS